MCFDLNLNMEDVTNKYNFIFILFIFFIFLEGGGMRNVRTNAFTKCITIVFYNNKMKYFILIIIIIIVTIISINYIKQSDRGRTVPVVGKNAFSVEPTNTILLYA